MALRLPIESHSVPDPARDHFVTRSIRIDTRDQGIAVRIRLADVAWRPDRYIQLAVRPEGDKFPSVHRLLRKRSVTTTGMGGFVSRCSMSSKRRMRLTAETYNEPFRY